VAEEIAEEMAAGGLEPKSLKIMGIYQVYAVIE
jgi:hypothetical protein